MRALCKACMLGGVLSYLLLWFWMRGVPLPTVSFHLLFSHFSTVSWLCVCGFVYQQELLCTVITHPVTAGHAWIGHGPLGQALGWSCVCCRTWSSLRAVCSSALHRMEHTPWPCCCFMDLFFLMLLRNQTQYSLTPPDLQCRTHCTRERRFFIFIIIFYFFPFTRNNSFFSCWRR